MLLTYWGKFNVLNRHYQFNIKILKMKKIRTKTKFFKKIVKKTRTTRKYRVLKLNCFFSQFTILSPPLSTFLNLLGIISQNFIEDFNKKYGNMYLANTVVILSFIVNFDLSYSYKLNLNYNALIKNIGLLDLLSVPFNNNLNILTFFKKKTLLQISTLMRQDEELFFLRYYFNSDVYCLIYLLFYQQLFLVEQISKSLDFVSVLLEYESFVWTLLGILKSYNLRFINYKIIKKKNV